MPNSIFIICPSYYLSGQEEEVEGTLSVQPQSNPVRGFEEYFLGLTVKNNKRNPWFVGAYYNRTETDYISVTKL